MKVTIEIEGPVACGKTRLAQFIENKLREEYSVKLVSFKNRTVPVVRELYSYYISPL